ncbi:PucR family transcriptional regulator [Peribacillus asahii]|uniref:PucR family transcriptional regulator n=1 Tax=Peribacillus asahii TaxID=228899 RepID=A0A398B7W4_9BACI|nr:PucR family transcriptional regulator [Peribacillus asahii]RID86045.1 PucR family transcriptional regulator [Peribacillus asahii]
MDNRHIFKDLYGDLMEFADRISSVLGCPITIEDNNHRLLAYSTHEDTTDQARISTIIGRRVPEKVINNLWKDGIIPALLKNDTPIKIAAIHEVGLGNRAAVSIRKNNDILGFIWALEVKKPFSEEDLNFLQFAAKEAKNQLQQLQLKKRRTEASQQEFLWRLITGHYQDEAEITANFKKLSLPTPLEFAIIVFEFPQDITREGERYISYMLTTSQTIKTFLFTVDQNKLIILTGTERVNDSSLFSSIYEFIPFFILEMKKRFGVEHILGASGRCYQQMENVMLSYKDALYTLQLKRIFPLELASVLHYEDLGIFQLLEKLSSDHKHLPHPSIRKLQEYDQKNQTSLLHTLTVYLETDGNPNEAAKQLHIHVNTLTYRLKRITEIGNVRLKDPLQKMSIFLDLKLIQYRQTMKKEHL